MRSSRIRISRSLAFTVLGAISVFARPAHAQTKPVQGFGVERFYPSAPGGGWLVMDTLDMRGDLGGAAALTTGYEHNPLRVASTDGTQHLAVVSDAAYADLSFAASYRRTRFSVNFTMPLLIKGDSGTVGNETFTAPNLDPSSHPDEIADVRLGVVTRLVGDVDDRFRLGIGAQLFVPSGNRVDYVSDHTYRAMGRVLAAGDVGYFTYAGHVGLHIRPLDNAPLAGSPQGSEFIFGGAAGVKLAPCGPCCNTAVILGPEVYGATAFASFFSTTGTALEALMSARVEGTGDGPQLRFKLGAGGGLNPHFGAPDARVVFGIEVFNGKAKQPPAASRQPAPP